MGLLFANMDPIDIPAEREAFQRAQESFAKEKLELAAEKKLLEDKLKELASR